MDTSYLVGFDFIEPEKSKANFQYLKRYIEENGFFEVSNRSIKAKIFNTELAFFLIEMKNIKAKNQLTKENTEINGFDFLNAYYEGFQEGNEYFNQHYKLKPDTIYGENVKEYVNDLHLHYFHNPILNGRHKGWNSFVRCSYPYLIISNKQIKNYGFYASLIDCVDTLITKYPNLFENFDKCQKEQQPEQKEQQPEHPLNKNQWKRLGVFLIELEKVRIIESQVFFNENELELLITKFFDNGLPKTWYKMLKTELNKRKVKIDEKDRSALIRLCQLYYPDNQQLRTNIEQIKN